MAGFSNTPPASEFHTHQSWGRTRQPKNLAGAHGNWVDNVGAGNVTADLAALNANATADRAARGYSTQNQRYLHITCDSGAAVTELFVYSHATDLWTQLIVGGASVAVAATQSEIVEIAGVDRVAFRGTSASGTKVFFAASTF